MGLRALLACLALAGCSTCPPSWSRELPEEDGWLFATGQAGEVVVEADARNLALTRAARVLAEGLGLDVETRLSVVLADDRLWVEAWGRTGPLHALDALELVDETLCQGRTWVLVRLPVSP